MPKRSYKAVFFDLDGTLLPIDMDAFLKNYFNDIAAFVQSRGHDPKTFHRCFERWREKHAYEAGRLEF